MSFAEFNTKLTLISVDSVGLTLNGIFCKPHHTTNCWRGTHPDGQRTVNRSLN